MKEALTSHHCNFTGKVVIVTGGGSGIGLAIARAFAVRGANLAIAGRDRERLARVASTLEAEAGRAVLATHADVARPEDCEAIVEAAATRFGALDILVNNAAHFALVPLLDAAGEDALRFFGPNLFGPLQCSRAFARKVIASGRRGAIINVSSIAGKRPAPGCGLYSATKAALDSLTLSMALEWAGSGVRVNAVAPGHVDTEGVLEDFRAGRLDEKAMLARIPSGRIASTTDIADAVMFLASDAARHIIGQVLTVDGGEAL